MIACFVRRQHAWALSWIADRAGRIASLLLPQVGDAHDLFRACETAERVLGVGLDQQFASSLLDMAGGRPCVATDLKPSSSATHSTPNFAWQMRVAFASMVSKSLASARRGSSRVLAVRGWYRRPRAAMAFRRRCCLLGAALIVTGRLRWPRLSEQIFRGDVRGRLMLTQSACLAGGHS